MRTNKHKGTSFESFIEEENHNGQVCDHSLLVAQFVAIEMRLAAFEINFARLHHEVAHYPTSQHPLWLPNQIAVCHELLRDLRNRIEKLSQNVANNNWVEAQEVTE